MWCSGDEWVEEKRTHPFDEFLWKQHWCDCAWLLRLHLFLQVDTVFWVCSSNILNDYNLFACAYSYKKHLLHGWATKYRPFLQRIQYLKQNSTVHIEWTVNSYFLSLSLSDDIIKLNKRQKKQQTQKKVSNVTKKKAALNPNIRQFRPQNKLKQFRARVGNSQGKGGQQLRGRLGASRGRGGAVNAVRRTNQFKGNKVRYFCISLIQLEAWNSTNADYRYQSGKVLYHLRSVICVPVS